jgi:hypothetical protein
VSGLVGGEGFAVDASLIQADANKATLDRWSGLAQGSRSGEVQPCREGVSGDS